MPDDHQSAALARFIREHQPDILDRWAAAIRDFPQLGRLSKPLLLDHLPAVIEGMAEGLDPEPGHPAPMSDYPVRHHANIRFQVGVDFKRLKAEYRVLREVILRLWRERPRDADTEAVLRLTALFDEALDTSYEQYMAARDETVLARPAVPRQSMSTLELASDTLERVCDMATTSRAAAVWLIEDGKLAYAASAGELPDTLPEQASLETVRDSCEARILTDAGEQLHLLPVMSCQRCLGVLAVWAPELSGENRFLYEIAADQIGLAIQLRELEEQAESLQRVTAIVERSEPLLVVDGNWCIVRVNGPQERISGIPRSKSVGRNFWEVFPGISEQSKAEYQRAMRERIPVFYETFNRSFGLWLDIAVYPTDEGGLAVFFRDVTARKKAEHALASAERRYQLLVDSVQDYAIVMTDSEGTIVSWNPGAERLAGYSRDEAVGQSVSIFYSEQDRAAGLPQKLRMQAEKQDRVHAQGWRIRKDGTRYWADLVYSRVPESDGTLAGYSIIVRDLTAHKRREDSLAFLEEAGKTLAESLAFAETAERVAALAVPRLADWCVIDYLHDEQCTYPLAIAHVDPEKARWAHELRKRFPPDPNAARGIFHTIRSGQPELIEEIPDEVLAEASSAAEYVEILQSLGLRSIMILPLIARGRTLGTITLVAAESGQRYREEDLLFAQQVAGRLALALDNARLFDDAQREVRLRGDMLAIVSHDLRSPLTATKLASALLARRLEDEALRKHVDTIQNAATQMDRLIDDLVDMVGIQSGKLRIELQPNEIAPLLEESIMQHNEHASSEGLALQAQLELPASLQVSCDTQRLKQVLGNLLGNAIKFSEPGSTIKLQARPESGMLRIEVVDEGPGIAPEDLPHLFKPYRSGRKHQSLGSGLGLYISKGIIEAHGGTIDVESKVGQGSTFFFFLPILTVPQGD